MKDIFFSIWTWLIDVGGKIDHDQILAGATVFIAAFTIILACMARRQIKLTKILERAYVAVEPLGINPFISDDGSVDKQILGHVYFVNVGRLPASNVVIAQPKIAWSDQVLQESDLKLDAMPPMNIVIPPGTKMPIGTAPYSPERLGNGGYIYVWGEIRYGDGFRKSRFTKFCHRYPCQPIELAPDGSKRIDAKHARYHQHGNDAD